MIFFAVAAPAPGRSSNCFWLAVLRSTGPAAAAAGLALAAADAAAGRARMSSADNANNNIDLTRSLLGDILDFLSGSQESRSETRSVSTWSPQARRVTLHSGLHG